MVFTVIYLIHSLLLCRVAHSQKLNPNEIAPNFTLSTLDGPIVYKGVNHPASNIHPPIIFHEFTNYSGFLEGLWTKDSSLLELVDNSPDNADYVFMTSERDANAIASWMKKRFEEILEKYYEIAKGLKRSHQERSGDRRSFDNEAHHKQYFPIPKRRIDRRSIPDTVELPKIRKPKIIRRSHYPHSSKPWDWHTYSKRNNIKLFNGTNDVRASLLSPFQYVQYDEDQALKRSIISHVYEDIAEDEASDDSSASSESSSDTNNALTEKVNHIVSEGLDKFKSDWLKRLHFVNTSLHELGNFIPLVMSRWYCSGHGCGYDQVAVEGKDEGSIRLITKRLDGRYDWLPSPYNLKSKHPRSPIVSFGDGCSEDAGDGSSGDFTDKIVLISNDNKCTYFAKLQNAQKKKALAAIIYTNPGEPLIDMTCEGTQCESEMTLPGTMIPYTAGVQLESMLQGTNDVYVRFQHTPSRNFFLAIDEQSKLQEVGWLLYPSMIFLSYQAKWLNYKTNLIHNITNMNATVVKVFENRTMQGERGVVVNTTFPMSLSEMKQYQHVYLDMALGCPGSTDYTCPHWDHTVQLYVCCDKSSPLCGKEIGRWITPFRRRIGRWLTNIRPLIPLFTTTQCTFTMKTVPWAMPWKPSLTLRFVDKKSGSIDAPDSIIPLFRGGKFDKDYNKNSGKKKREEELKIPSDVTRVLLFATITGHGSDNNNCAEFCVTSHHFIVNEKYENTRIFDSAGTATGCADRVSDGSEPNEHGTWLYGRNGWCDGENVSPWVEDITSQINKGKTNKIKYHGYFNDTDPNPTRDPGDIIMYSYLVLYKSTG